jgi:hypothetical protein
MQEATVTADDLYGIKSSNLKTNQALIAAVLDLTFEERESSYRGGEYYIATSHHGEISFQLNYDYLDKEFFEENFPDYELILYVRGDSTWAEKMRQALETRAPHVILLRHETQEPEVSDPEESEHQAQASEAQPLPFSLGNLARKSASSPRWMWFVLWAAGIYNICWGALVVLWPNAMFRWAGMASPNYPEIWQSVGMIVGVYGVGYIIAAYAPFHHWPIVLVGFLGKLFGPIGMASAIIEGRLPLVAGLVCATNDLIWWVPFGLILYRTYVNSRVIR